MKIIAPLTSIQELERYLELGAEEFYLGLNDSSFEKKIDNKWDSLDERIERKAHLNDIGEIKKIKEIILKANKRPPELHLTLNRAFYTDEQVRRVKEQILATKDYVDRYIVADPAIITLIKELAPEKGIVLSCISVCLNSEAVKFYRKLGVRRIILPRDLSLKEMKDLISKNKDMEFEVIILNQFCRNINGLCFRCHIPEKEVFSTICNIPFKQKTIPLNNSPDTLKNLALVRENTSSILEKFNPFCGMCFIKELERIGVASLKIVGRDNDFKRKINDFIFLKEILSLTHLEEKEFETKSKSLFFRYYGFNCNNNCYYST